MKQSYVLIKAGAEKTNTCFLKEGYASKGGYRWTE